MCFPDSFPFDIDSSSSQRSGGALRVGTGTAIGHHGELLQGVFPDEKGRLHRALLTLPFSRAQSVVTFWPEERQGIRTRLANRSKAVKAAQLAFQELGFSEISGCLTFNTAIPMGSGYGSSTADVVAAIRAAAGALGADLRRSVICRLAVAAEVASDALVFGEQAVLFAHREGRVLETFPGDYPPLLVVGFASRDDTAVDTVSFTPARYDSAEIESFRVLRALARRAIDKQDATLLGRVATASARINQRYLPKRHFEALLWIADEAGCCGVQVAHSGNLMGVLIDAALTDAANRAKAAAESARACGFCDIVRFSVNVDGMSVWC